MTHPLELARLGRVFLRCLLVPLALGAQPAGQAFAQAAADATKLAPVTVTAQKEAQPLEAAPVSVTAATHSFLADSGTRSVNEAAMFAPNTYVAEFSARKLSNPRFRGIGSSPNNPGVTTYLDGVPQLNANTSSMELIGVDQIEFVRGPQGTLFGRNTVGGLITITSLAPSLNQSSGSLVLEAGDYNLRDARFAVSTPLAINEAAVSFAGGYSSRDGFVTNPLTGHDLDWRQASFGKAQFLWHPSKEWDARLLLSGERARDGDYRLNDLLAVRADPTKMPRNFEGFTNRDILAPTLQVNGRLGPADLALTTGYVSWKTLDLTDLDYSAAPLIERSNAEKGTQFTQEIRFSSPSSAAKDPLTWQAGAFFFTQSYSQDSFNFFPNPVFLRYPPGTPAFRSYSQGDLDDHGVGIFGQTTFKAQDWSVSGGLRADFENKKAALRTFTAPAGFGGATSQNLSDNYREISPTVSASYQTAPAQSVFATIARGYKAGGFNAASPAGTERFAQERSWNYEAGYKASLLDHRLRTNLSAFYTRWTDLQLNVPALTPGQFYTANVGAARTHGVEFELTARAAAGWDIFAGAGQMSATFNGGTKSNGVNVGGHRLPFSPDYTLNGGSQYMFTVAKDTTAFVRGEVTAFGKFYYDDQNVRSQGAYALANFRVGVRARNWTLEVWAKNAFDQAYIPMAIPYSLAPSGFIGEGGAPRTTGVSAGLRF